MKTAYTVIGLFLLISWIFIIKEYQDAKKRPSED